MSFYKVGNAELHREKHLSNPIGLLSFQAYFEVKKEIERLKAIIADRSCCCSGCTKHNIALEEKYDERMKVEFPDE